MHCVRDFANVLDRFHERSKNKFDRFSAFHDRFLAFYGRFC
jgi:hypothetical protein